MSNWISFLTRIADIADDIALEYFNSAKLGVEFKDNMTPVSAGDLAIENEIRALVKKEHPELSIIGEEYGQTSADSDLTLIIDPIDGTKNFIRGLPFFGSLFAIEDHGEIVAGMVSAPALNDRWWASKGAGAFYNEKQIHVSTITTLDEANGLHGSIFGSEACSTLNRLSNYCKILIANAALEIFTHTCWLLWVVASMPLISNSMFGILQH